MGLSVKEVRAVIRSMEAVAKMSITRTRLAEKQWMENLNPEKKLTAKAKRLQDLSDACASFGCHATKVRKLAELLIKEPLPMPTSSKKVLKNNLVIDKKGIMLVPLMNKNGHSYHLNEPCMVSQAGSSSNMLKTNGSFGNTLDVSDRAVCRYATNDEIEWFFKHRLGVLYSPFNMEDDES